MPFSPCDSANPSTCQEEASLDILRHVFGDVIDKLVAGASPVADMNILAEMLKFFNSGVLVIGAIIASYTAVMGVINTANDGEVLGKNWSATATPLRIVAGAATLLPTASGYNFIQLIVLMIALWSVGFANGVYKAGVAAGILSPAGLIDGAYEPGTAYGFRDYAAGYVQSLYCMRAAEEIYFNPSAQPAHAQRPRIRWQNRVDWYTTIGNRSTSTYEAKDENGYTNLGGSHGGAGPALCGTTKEQWPMPPTTSDAIAAELDIIDQQVSRVKWQKLREMEIKLRDWVNTWPPSLEHNGWHTIQPSRFNTIVRETEAAVATELAALSTSGPKNALQNLVDNLTAPGWAGAAGWFQRAGTVRQRIKDILARPISVSSPPILTGLADDARRARLVAAVESAPQQVLQKATNSMLPTAQRQIGATEIGALFPADPMGGFNTSALADDVNTKMSSFIGRWMETLVELATGANSDGTSIDLCRTSVTSTMSTIGGSVLRMKCVGDALTVVYGTVYMLDTQLKNVVTAVRVTGGLLGSVKVVGSGVDPDKVTTPLWDWVLHVISPGLATIATTLRPIAFYFGVLLPSMPYIIFMIVVVGWILQVLQAMFATPLWMLMHMRPDRTFVGSEKQGYLLLLGLFARPALAVLGLFAALLVIDPIIDFVATGFFTMRTAIVSSTAALGFVAEFVSFLWWLSVFGLVLLPIMYMCFGLAQALPDRVLGWLNAGTPDLGESNASHKFLASAAATGNLPGVLGQRRNRDRNDSRSIGGPGQPKQLEGPDGSGSGGGGGPRGGGGGGNGVGRRGGQQQQPLLGHQGVGPMNRGDDVSPARSGDGSARGPAQAAGGAKGAPLAGGQGAGGPVDRPGARSRPSGAFGRYEAFGTSPPVAPADADRGASASMYRSSPGNLSASSGRSSTSPGSGAAGRGAVLTASGGAGSSTLREKQAEADATGAGHSSGAPATAASSGGRSAGGDIQQRARPTQRDLEAEAAAETAASGSHVEQRPAGTHKTLPPASGAGTRGSGNVLGGQANPPGARAAADRQNAAELQAARETAKRDSKAEQSAAPSERPAPHIFDRTERNDGVINQGPEVRRRSDDEE